jgi:acyl-CoA thioester hydrolase
MPEHADSEPIRYASELMHSTSRTRVRYKETDQMGIAHHSNYLVWFEIGRTDLCRLAGFSYREIEERGYMLVVSEVGCRYRSPFRYDDEVVIETRVGQIGSRMLRFDYELRSDSGDLRASGHSSHIWVEQTGRQPATAPADVLDAFRKLVDQGSQKRVS